ncbi:TIGR02300 family protein [Brevundimonas sp.]|uniref:TIGR02300 family protein n=1 Tax=Brevundimonas sp. TaxID=1871086 RepID=UPI002E0FACD7|nr:TIGR02300 family protein [Brevundimonas sp.]
MANPELGAKQVCPNCQAKFYDLNRRPAHCPKCGTDFDPEEALKLRNRRGRPAGVPDTDDEAEDQVKDKSADGDEDEEEAVATPEIDEEGHEPILTPDDEDDDAKDPTEESGMGEAVDDDDLADDDDDSVPFIEDEDDDDSFEDEIVKPGDDE